MYYHIVSSYGSYWLFRFFSYLFTRWGSIHRCILYIRNNNALHKQQTIQLSLLNTSSLTFILFAACLLRLQCQTLYHNIKLVIPSDILIKSQQLQKDHFLSFLQDSRNTPFIKGYEFMRAPFALSSQLTSYSGYSTLTPLFTFFSSNYLSLMY